MNISDSFAEDVATVVNDLSKKVCKRKDLISLMENVRWIQMG